MHKRQLYHRVDENWHPWDEKKKMKDFFTEEKIADIAKETQLAAGKTEWPTADDIAITIDPTHYGSGKTNPLEKVRFYSKYNPNGELLSSTCNRLALTRAVSYFTDANTGSHALPRHFGEVLMRVFVKNDQ